LKERQGGVTGDSLNRVRQLVADVLGASVDEVNVTTSHEDVPAWDSLNIVKLAMAVEAEFGVTITPDDAMNLTSVKAILDVVQKTAG
jgi:acyl carrier protein